MTIREYLFDRAKRQADNMSDEMSSLLAGIWLNKVGIIGIILGDDSMSGYPDWMLIRIGKSYGRFLSETMGL